MATEPALSKPPRDPRFAALVIVGIALVVVVALLTLAVMRSTSQHAAIERAAGCRSRAASAVEAVGTAKGIEADQAQAGITEALKIVGTEDVRSAEGTRHLKDAVADAAAHAERVRLYNRRLPELARLRAASTDECTRDSDWRIPEHLTAIEP